MQKASQIAERLVHKPYFEYTIIALILLNGVLLGLGTSPSLERQFGGALHLGNQLILAVFVAEALLKMLSHAPRVDNYFRDGWNVFDFLIIVLALVPATGDYAMIARLARLLRVLRLISAVMELRLIVSALVRSIPSVGHVMLLMGIIVYIYAIIGYQLFHEHDPMHWRSLGASVLTLFNIITLEGWTVVMDNAMQLHSWAWIYFVSYVVIATFVVINLFVAIIINNLDQANAERLRELEPPVTREELLRELRSTRSALRRLEHRLDEEGISTRDDGTDDDGKADNSADKKQIGRE
ncbi:MAG: ion transporter [Chloroflexi bacterium]|nr:ion transporter [Chloroflexota bacterium]